MSLSSTTISNGLVHPNDGHIEGHLNCIAVRHGWTRTFSMSPAEVNALDYASLERTLELPTLKLRAVRLRIYIESPAGSGILCKVRFWKDDGSLQSILIKEFFESRRIEGEIMRFEVRDGRERSGGVWEEDGHVTPAGESVASEAPTSSTRLSPRKKRSISFDWFSKRQPVAAPDNDKKPSTARRVIDFFVTVATRPASMYHPIEDATPLAPRADNEGENEDKHEDEHQQRLARRKSQLKARIASASSTSPFFSASATRGSARAAPHFSDSGVIMEPSPSRVAVFNKSLPDAPEDAESDGEIVVAEDYAREFAKKSSSNPLDKLRPFMTRAVSAPNVPIRKLKRRPTAPTKKERPVVRDDPKRFKGAVVIRRPEEAFPPRAGSALAGAVGDDGRPASENLLDDDDPFRG